MKKIYDPTVMRANLDNTQDYFGRKISSLQKLIFSQEDLKAYYTSKCFKTISCNLLKQSTVRFFMTLQWMLMLMLMYVQ